MWAADRQQSSREAPDLAIPAEHRHERGTRTIVDAVGPGPIEPSPMPFTEGGGNDQIQRRAHGRRAGVTEHRRGLFVPRLDATVAIDKDDGVIAH